MRKSDRDWVFYSITTKKDHPSRFLHEQFIAHGCVLIARYSEETSSILGMLDQIEYILNNLASPSPYPVFKMTLAIFSHLWESIFLRIFYYYILLLLLLYYYYYYYIIIIIVIVIIYYYMLLF